MTGIDAAIIAKALTPLIGQIGKTAGTTTAKAFQKWKAAGFAKKLAAKLATADKIKTIWSPDKETSLLSIYYPSKIRTADTVHTVSSLSDLPKGNLVIEGIVGHGKSMFLRYLYLQELAGKGEGYLPIFIELRTLTEKRDLDTHLREALEKMEVEFDQAVLDFLAQEGRLVLLLDGFDELDEAIVASTLQRIEYLRERYENLRIIVTSRPSAEIQKSRLFSTVPLLGLTKEDYSGFLHKLGVAPEKALEIVEAIRKSPSDVSNLITTPLMMTLVAMVYESEKEIPSELPEFFDKLFVTMFTRHDRLKAGFNRKHYSGLSERKLQQLFEVFCFAAIRQRFGRSLSSEQFNQAFEKAIHYSSALKCEADAFRRDIVKVACLMVEEGFDLTTFLHKSIPEYFAAAFVRRANDEFAQKFYSAAALAYENWSAVLTFLEKTDAYRFAKFYTIPTFDKFFNEVKMVQEKVTPLNVWVDYFSKLHPMFGVAYGKDEENGSKNWILKRFGPYKSEAPFGQALNSRLVNAVISALQESMPREIDESTLIGSESVFTPTEEYGMLEYFVLYKAALKEFGEAASARQFDRFETVLWGEYAAAQLQVKQEEDKKEMLDDLM